MQIIYECEPVVGEKFQYSVVECAGAVSIGVFVAGGLRWQKKCPTPPCHETLAITRDLRGQVLRIHASDTSGASDELELVVVDNDEESMTAGASR